MNETVIVETPIHGRCLVRRGHAGSGTVIGFHGYAETAEIHLLELESIPQERPWTLVAVQALHPFYVKGGKEIVASWMTSLDRVIAVRDNLEYVVRVMAALNPAPPLIFVGFSQGAAMAWRAAASFPCAGVIVLGGDVPTEIDPSALPPALIGRGARDEWYTEEKLMQDLRFLVGRPVEIQTLPGGHAWTDEFRSAAGDFMRRAGSAPD